VANELKQLRVAYTPDSDDVFNYYAWEHGRVAFDTQEYRPVFHRDHIAALNRAAQEERFDVVGVSSAVYPNLADRYWILAVGNSIGRACGPVLVSKHYATLEDLGGKRVAVGGIPTTGSTLAQMYCPGAEFVEMTYTAIADAVARNEIDAGVMIHEELLYFPKKGLRCVCDLGRAWFEDTGLPLPVGLNLVRKALGMELAGEVATTCERSLIWGFEHRDEVYAFARQFGRGEAKKHTEMFSNEDTLRLQSDVLEAMHIMFERVARLGIGPKIDSFDIIEGSLDVDEYLRQRNH
jgi:1,4-dihydroxy-6-naphthoate synthase